MGADYRVYVMVRRRGKAPFNIGELPSEDFDTDEEYCLAIASNLLEELKACREEDEE
jgi:hypothetical protein